MVARAMRIGTPSVSYTAQGVLFDGSDRMARGAALSSVADTKVGICSFWFKLAGSEDSDFHIFLEDSTFGVNGFRVMRNASQPITFTANNSGNSCFGVSTNSTFLMPSSSWIHIIAAWSLSTTTFQLYVNDVSDIEASPTKGNFNVPWTTATDWFFGQRSGASLLLNSNVADFYLNTAEYLDISNSTNRRKFISAGGAPVDLGTTGSTPTGNAPSIFLHGTTASWHTNDGTGGGFTLTGTLTDSSTNPP